MKSLKYIYLIFACTFFIFGCDGEDPFSTILEVEPPEHIKQLAVHCYISSHDNRVFASLSETRALLDESDGLESVNNGTVSIYKDGEKLFDLEPYPDNYAYNYFHDATNPIGILSGEIELRATAPGYPDLTATQNFPTLVPLTEVEFEEEGMVAFGGEILDRISFTFTDPADEENYYEFGVISIDSTCVDGNVYSYSKYIETQDLNARVGADWDALIMNDASFNGLEYTLILGVNHNSREDLYLHWKCISKEHFQYSSSLRAFGDNQDFGTFGEPVSIFSNVENGIGVFSCASGELSKIATSSSIFDSNEMSWEVDGDLLISCDINGFFSSQFENNSFSGYGQAAESSISIQLDDLSEGTFEFPQAQIYYDDFNAQTGYNNFEDGEITVTLHDEDAGYVEGVFSGTLKSFDSEETIEMTNGVFKIYYEE